MLVAIRDAESRTRFCGYRVEHYKLFVWTFSAMLAGIGGALYVPQVGIINPGEFAPANSIEAVIWVAFGGRGTLWGAILGGVGVNAIKSWLTGSFPELWLYALGVLFVATTLFLPKGIAGLVTGLWAKRGAPTPVAPGWPRARGSRDERRHRDHPRRPRPGTILYLDGVSVSFDGFKALNELSLLSRQGRDAGNHRPERRRQDYDDGRHHRQDPAGQGHGPVPRGHRPHPARRGGHRPARHRAEVPETHRVREPYRLDQPRAGAEGRARPVAALLFGLSGEQRDRIDEILSTVRLEDPPRRLAGELSHGQKQWLEIGMLLVQDPELLLVDEPVAGMTDAETESTGELLREIAESHSVVVVEHDMDFVRALEVQGHRAARRLGPGRREPRSGAEPTSASSRSIWGAEPC